MPLSVDKKVKIEGKNPKKRHLKRAGIIVVSILLFLCVAGAFLMYGPFSYFRNLWISTAMETNDHQWLANLLYDQKTINQVIAETTPKVPDENTDPNAITIMSKSQIPKDNATELPTSPSDGEHIIDGVGFIKLRHDSLKGDSYNGWLIKVYDPSRLFVGVSEDLGTKGEHLSHMAEQYGAFAGVNAGPFDDPGGHGNGGTPRGIFIQDGKVLSGGNEAGSNSIIGFNNQNKMILGSFTLGQLKTMNLKFAIEFSPILIVNGKRSDVSGPGIQPRTAIGQTKDGVILLLVIDGRTISSPGATMQDVQDLMAQYGAVNAVNTDGGSSSVFIYKNKVINVPSGPSGERWLPNGFLIKK